jgi:fructosamine-3-kinase
MNREGAAEAVGSITGSSAEIISLNRVGGGCISSAWKVSSKEQTWFLKKAAGPEINFLKAEARGLQELELCESIRTPKCLGHYEKDNFGFLVLEHLEMTSHSPESQHLLGQQLAAMHRIRSDRHGFCEDNFIGSHVQINSLHNNWIEFYSECRLIPQAEDTGDTQVISKTQQLCSKLTNLFGGYTPFPSLLHGDLWGGNTSCLKAGTPVIFDPAVYYGDRETDIAFTEMFGGFSREFYQAYNEEFPLDHGYSKRKDLYQLYHYLNHANIFGGSYIGSARRILDSLLSIV